MLKNDGFTLTELIIVVGIFGLLLGMAAIAAHDWLINAQVEDQMREMYADLTNARASAMQRNRVYFVRLAANQYSLYEDTNPSPDGDGALQTGQDRLALQRTTKFTLDAGGVTGFNFMTSGLASVTTTTFSVRGISTTSPGYDCILISATRILMGKWDGTNCNAQ